MQVYDLSGRPMAEVADLIRSTGSYMSGDYLIVDGGFGIMHQGHGVLLKGFDPELCLSRFLPDCLEVSEPHPNDGSVIYRMVNGYYCIDWPHTPRHGYVQCYSADSEHLASFVY